MQKVIPAILTADSEDLKEKLSAFRGISEWMHIDIMDGEFVPNVSVGIQELKEFARDFCFEIHLMVQNPANYVEDCKAIGAGRIIIHQEAAGAIEKALKKMKVDDLKAGIALNPLTSVDVITPFASNVICALIMGVRPGVQGQEFMPSVLEKIAMIKKDFPHLKIGVDGGVGEANIFQIFQAGAEYAVVGSGIIRSQDPIAVFRKLQEMIN